MKSYQLYTNKSAGWLKEHGLKNGQVSGRFSVLLNSQKYCSPEGGGGVSSITLFIAKNGPLLYH